MRKKNGKNSCLYNKKKITRWLEDRNLFSRGEKQYFTHSSKAFDTLPHDLIVSKLRLSSLDTSAVARLDLLAGAGAIRSAEGTSC